MEASFFSPSAQLVDLPILREGSSALVTASAFSTRESKTASKSSEHQWNEVHVHLSRGTDSPAAVAATSHSVAARTTPVRQLSNCQKRKTDCHSAAIMTVRSLTITTGRLAKRRHRAKVRAVRANRFLMKCNLRHSVTEAMSFDAAFQSTSLDETSVALTTFKATALCHTPFGEMSLDARILGSASLSSKSLNATCFGTMSFCEVP